MAKVKLTNYLNKVEAKYILAREKWEKVQALIEAENAKYNNDLPKLSALGQNERDIEHKELLSGYGSQLEEIRKDFMQEVESIKADSDKVFNNVYQYNPAAVDTKGLAILQNAELSANDLINLADTYKNAGNNTMFFLIADKMKAYQEKATKGQGLVTKTDLKAAAYYTMAQDMRKERPDHNVLDNFAGACMNGLRNEKALSNGVHKAHIEFYNSNKQDAEKITAESAPVWD